MTVTKKKGKRASANYTTHWFSKGKKTSTKPSNKTTRKYANITKRNVLASIILVSSLERKKKWNTTERTCAKRWSGTEKPLQKTKGVKVNNLATEMDEGMRKTIAKNNSSRLIHIQIQNAKKQVIEHTKNCVQWMCPHDTKYKMKISKKNSTIM